MSSKGEMYSTDRGRGNFDKGYTNEYPSHPQHREYSKPYKPIIVMQGRKQDNNHR